MLRVALRRSMIGQTPNPILTNAADVGMPVIDSDTNTGVCGGGNMFKLMLHLLEDMPLAYRDHYHEHPYILHHTSHTPRPFEELYPFLYALAAMKR